MPNPIYGGFSALVKNADITNRDVPEPTSSLLVLLGLSALAISRRRR
jgi:hypothetical protein